MCLIGEERSRSGDSDERRFANDEVGRDATASSPSTSPPLPTDQPVVEPPGRADPPMNDVPTIAAIPARSREQGRTRTVYEEVARRFTGQARGAHTLAHGRSMQPRLCSVGVTFA